MGRVLSMKYLQKNSDEKTVNLEETLVQIYITNMQNRNISYKQSFINSDNEGSNELQERDLKSKVNDNQEMDLDKLRHLVHCT